MTRGITTFGLLIVAALAAVATPAAAQPSLTPEQRQVAAEHFERGSVAYERGDYDEAEAEFRASYEITEHPDLLYNVYTAAERGGRLEPAAEALEGYLERGDPEPARREALEIRAERLRNRIAEQRAREAQQEAQAERERVQQEAQLREAEEAASTERAQRMDQIRAGHATSDALVTTGVIGLGAGGAAAVVFAVFAGLSEAEDGALAGRCGRDAGRYCAESDVDALRGYNTAADVSWIVAASLGAVGGALILVGEALRPGEDGETPSAWLAPAVGPDLAGLSAGGRW